LFDGVDEDLAVADLVGLGSADNGGDGGIDLIVREDDLDLYLGQEVDDIFGTAIELGMAFLAAEALDLDNAEALNAGLLKRLFHLVKFERLDDRFDLLHGLRLPLMSGSRRLSTSLAGEQLARVAGRASPGSKSQVCTKFRQIGAKAGEMKTLERFE
jgi:hypothetical protein